MYVLLLITALLLMGVGVLAATSAVPDAGQTRRGLLALGVFVLVAGIVALVFAVVGLMD